MGGGTYVQAAGARDIIRFYLNDNVLQGGAALARGQRRVGVEAAEAGGARGSIQITDAYGHLTDIPYDFTAFFNLPPVCRINITNIKEYSPYEAIIDLIVETQYAASLRCVASHTDALKHLQ